MELDFNDEYLIHSLRVQGDEKTPSTLYFQVNPTSLNVILMKEFKMGELTYEDITSIQELTHGFLKGEHYTLIFEDGTVLLNKLEINLIHSEVTKELYRQTRNLI